MAINKTELSQEELTNVTGGGYSVGGNEYSVGGNEYNVGGGTIIPELDNKLFYSSAYPYYLDPFGSKIEGCAGFKSEAGSPFARCVSCDYYISRLCTLRTKDNDPYA